MYRISVNHDSCHQINLSVTGNACLINETEGKPRVSCISISTVLFLAFIPLAVVLQINNIYYFSVIFLLRPPLTVHNSLLPSSYFPPSVPLQPLNPSSYPILVVVSGSSFPRSGLDVATSFYAVATKFSHLVNLASEIGDFLLWENVHL